MKRRSFIKTAVAGLLAPLALPATPETDNFHARNACSGMVRLRVIQNISGQPLRATHQIIHWHSPAILDGWAQKVS